MKCYLRIDSDHLEDARRFSCIQFAKDYFMATATELDRYGQRTEASIHIASHINNVAEYPDYVLSLGPQGGLKCERA